MSSTSTVRGSDNELWNETHVALVKYLEKRGTLWRYGAKHLKLWTDEILNGNSGGANDEPLWDKHIDAVSVPPKTKKTQATGSPTSTNNLLQMMFLQQQQQSEFMQTALLACLSNSPNFQVS